MLTLRNKFVPVLFGAITNQILGQEIRVEVEMVGLDITTISTFSFCAY